mgnify:CR=1 FL=1
MKKFMVNAVIAVSLGAMTLSSCIGSFGLTNKVLDWNKGATDNKFINELIFLVISPAYAVCSVADLFRQTDSPSYAKAQELCYMLDEIPPEMQDIVMELIENTVYTLKKLNKKR